MRMRRRFRRPIMVSTVGGRLTKRQKRGIRLIIIGLALLLLGINFSSNLIPVTTEMAITEAYELVTTAVNEAINEKMADGSLSYDQLVSLEKDAAGNITALTTDMAQINTLQAEITNQVIAKVSEMGSANLSIPLGNIIGGSLLSGRGPGIPIRVITLANSSASFSNDFSSAGINQTKHQILLDLTVNVNIMVPGNTTTEAITTQVLIAETVIVGDVPDSYINLE